MIVLTILTCVILLILVVSMSINNDEQHDISRASEALKRIESGESILIDWEDAKKELGI